MLGIAPSAVSPAAHRLSNGLVNSTTGSVLKSRMQLASIVGLSALC